MDGLADYRVRALENGELAEVEGIVADAPVPSGPAVWSCGFDGDRRDCAYGPCPEGWTPAWIPGHEPSPDATRWIIDPVWGHRESDSLCILVGDGYVNSGAGRALPDGSLVEGRPYRLQGWMRVHESIAAADCVVLLQASAWSGPERPVWDAWTDCVVGLESPRRGAWVPVSVDFVAGPVNHVYFLAHSNRVPPGGTVKIWISDTSIVPLDRSAPPEPRPSPIGHLECEVMAFGEYLLRRYDPASPWPT
jgi:hypothetical protein